MKATLLLSAALLLVTKSGEAAVNIHSDGKPPLGQFAFHRAGKNTVRSGAKTQKPGNSESDVRSVAASPTSENNTRREEMPGDRPSDSAWEGRSRRLAAGRSHAQPKSPGRTAVVQGDRASGAPLKDSRGAPNLLLSFAGKSRLLVISAPHHSDGYYRLMVSLLKPEVYCQLAERHVHQIVMFHQDGETAGEVRYISSRGQVVEEPLEAPLIPRLMNFLRLEKGKFGMVLLRKTLQVEQRYPYPVRLEAIFEVIDGAPARRFEKVRQEGFMQKCKGAGVEGQVVEGQVVEGQVVDGQVVEGQVVEGKDVRKPVPGPDRTTWAQTTTTSTTTITVTSKTQTASTASINPAGTAQSSTTATWSTRTRPSFMTVNPASTTQAQTISQWIVPTKTSSEPYHYPPTRDPQGSRYYLRTTPNPTSPNDYYSKGYTSRYLNNITDTKGYNKKYLDVTSAQPNLSHIRLFNKKSEGGVPNGDYEDKSERKRPMGGEPEESQKGKEDVVERRKRKKRRRKEKEKADKTDGLLKMAAKVGKGEDRSKNTGEKVSKSEGEIGFQKPGRKRTLPKGSLSSFLGYFDGKRRLILITTPCEDHPLYVQQRDGFLEHVCEMALRKVSIITILGNLTNGTMKIDHYQLEHDEPMRGLRRDDLVNQDLIIELRKGFGMTYDHFYMGLTDFDLKVKQYYQVPIVMKAVLDYIDMFSSRIQEMEQQKRDRLTCKKEDNPRSLENFLSRFRWRRRLFIISTPADEDWTYQLQLHALSSQACHLGLRHVSVLKLVGVDAEMGGVVELYPINGSATIEREGISASLVKDIRNYFQVSPEYFSMLLVGKDGNVKSWYPSPMWSMAIVYDLVDSMQLCRQEMAIQQSLGMRCPEDEYGGYDDPHRGYHHGYQDGYDPVRDGR